VVRRFVLVVIVALLAFSASGAFALVVPEPCSVFEQTGSDDGACPPTCVTCGCCAQPLEAMALTVATAPDSPLAAPASLISGLPKTAPGDILHVPRLRRA
jgi:hypothetical protein